MKKVRVPRLCLLDFGMVCYVPEGHRKAWAQCVVHLAGDPGQRVPRIGGPVEAPAKVRWPCLICFFFLEAALVFLGALYSPFGWF